MFYSTTDGQYINEGTQFVLDGITYPPQWLNQSTPEQKTQLGLVEVIATNSPANPEYYWVSEELNEATLTYINTPKELSMIKDNCLNKINQIAYSLLLPSDWMASKAFETDTKIPNDWALWRNSIRKTARDTNSLISSAKDVEEIEILMNNVTWEQDPNTIIKTEI